MSEIRNPAEDKEGESQQLSQLGGDFCPGRIRLALLLRIDSLREIEKGFPCVFVFYC